MPIFDYRCEACGHTFDILQKLGAEPLTDCSECGAAELRKLLSAPSFHLKGKGWRKSDDKQKKPDTRPKFVHTFDSATPHAEHSHDKPDHTQSHDEKKSDGHSHGEKKSHSHGSHGHSHAKRDAGKKGHTHSHSHGHKHDH